MAQLPLPGTSAPRSRFQRERARSKDPVLRITPLASSSPLARAVPPRRLNLTPLRLSHAFRHAPCPLPFSLRSPLPHDRPSPSYFAFCDREGETLAAIEEEFESFRRLNEDFIDRSKSLLVDPEPFGGETSGQFCLDDKLSRPVANASRLQRREPLNEIIEGANTGNDALERIVLVFGFLRNEARVLKDLLLDKALPFLLLFGESFEDGGGGGVVDGEGHLKFAAGIKSLSEVVDLVDRTKAVLTNLVQQCYAVHADSGDTLALYKTFQDVGLKSVMMSIGQCLYILQMVDSAVKSNPLLLTCSSMFQGTLNAVSTQPDKYGMTAEQVDKLGWDLQNIDRLLSSSRGNLQ